MLQICVLVYNFALVKKHTLIADPYTMKINSKALNIITSSMPSAILLSLAIISPTQFTAQAYQSSSINDGWTFSYQNDTAATPIHLPHSWNSDAYHTRQYKRGTGTYTKTLQIPQNLQGRKIYLKFDGAATNSQILINGKAVGSHVGGYSPMSLTSPPMSLPVNHTTSL